MRADSPNDSTRNREISALNSIKCFMPSQMHQSSPLSNCHQTPIKCSKALKRFMEKFYRVQKLCKISMKITNSEANSLSKRTSQASPGS